MRKVLTCYWWHNSSLFVVNDKKKTTGVWIPHIYKEQRPAAEAGRETEPFATQTELPRLIKKSCNGKLIVLLVARKWDQCRMMGVKRGLEHIPVESLSLRGEHVIVRMHVVYRGIIWFIMRAQSNFSKRQENQKQRQDSGANEFRTCCCFHFSLSARVPFPCSFLSRLIRQLKPHPCRIKGCGLGPHHPLYPDFGKETSSLIRFQCDPEEQWKARTVPSLPPT